MGVRSDTDFASLMDDWGEDYELESGTIIQGIPDAVSGEEALKLPRLRVMFKSSDLTHVLPGASIRRMRDYRLLAANDMKPDGFGYTFVTLSSRGAR